LSLVNDALRRAQEAQPRIAPPSGPRQPPQAPQRIPKPRTNSPLIRAAAISVALLIGAFFRWQTMPRHQANQAIGTITVSEAPWKDLEFRPLPTPATLPSMAAATPAPAVIRNPIAQTPASINPPPPAPKPPKLQALVFDPRRPSAIINGKTVFIGDTSGEFKVTALGPESATLVNSNQTLVLTME